MTQQFPWIPECYPTTISLIWYSVRRAIGLRALEPLIVRDDWKGEVYAGEIQRLHVLLPDDEAIAPLVSEWIDRIVEARPLAFLRLPLPRGLYISDRLDAADGFSLRVTRDYNIHRDQSVSRLDVAFR